MKFSVEYVKKNPVLFGGILLVFGVLFYLYLNRGAAGSSSTTVVSSGPTDAQLAAQTQLGIAQIGANAQTAGYNAQIGLAAQQGANDFALAQLARDVDLAQIAADATTSAQSINAQLVALHEQITGQVQMNANNNSFQLDYAKTTYSAAQAQTDANIALQEKLSGDQLKAYQTGILFNSIAMAPEVDRDNLIALAAGVTTGSAVNYYQNGTYKGKPKVEQLSYTPPTATAPSTLLGNATSSTSSNG